MTIDYDITKIFSGLRRKRQDQSKEILPPIRKKHSSPAGALTALLAIYVCSLLLIYAAIGRGGETANGGFAMIFNQSYAESPDVTGLAEENPDETAAQDASALLTEEYNRTVQDAAKAYIDRIEEDLIAAQKTTAGEAPVFLTADRALPVFGEITSVFAQRENPFYTENGTEEKYEFHSGVDIIAEVGTPVFAYAKGVVMDASVSKSYGNYIIVAHESYDTLYAHLDTMIVKEGDRVQAGDKIGFSGNTGRSTAPHLHFEVRIDGEAVDPLAYLS